LLLNNHVWAAHNRIAPRCTPHAARAALSLLYRIDIEYCSCASVILYCTLARAHLVHPASHTFPHGTMLLQTSRILQPVWIAARVAARATGPQPAPRVSVRAAAEPERVEPSAAAQLDREAEGLPAQ
jgi:hypothetical protein